MVKPPPTAAPSESSLLPDVEVVDPEPAWFSEEQKCQIAKF